MKLAKRKAGRNATIRGVPARFSLHPARVGATGHLPARDPWSYLRYWCKANSDIGDDEKIASIAFLNQSESFSRAALVAAQDSSPLLWYYSFLNLAKAFLCASGKEKLTKLEGARHGIGEPADNADGYLKLSKQEVSVWSKYDNKLNLQVFPALCEALGTPYPAGRVSVKHLLRSIASIHQASSAAFEEAPIFLRCIEPEFRVKANSHGKSGDLWVRLSIETADVAASPYAYKDLKPIIETNSLLHGCKPIRAGLHTFESDPQAYGNADFQKKLTALKGALRPMVHPIVLPSQYRYYLLASPNPHLHQAAAIYAVMFYLGSIVRYQPHRFDKLIEKKEQWVIAEFLKVCPKQYIMLLSNEITRTDMAYVEGL